MRKFFLIFVFLFLFLFFPLSSFAQNSDNLTPDQAICYSQCAAYEFVWEGNACWDLFQEHCVKDQGEGFKSTIKFLKRVYDIVNGGKELKGLDTVVNAWILCKPLIEDCISPVLHSCKETCQYYSKYFVPDLSVGNQDGLFRGIVYDPIKRILYFKVVNNGMAYAWDIDVEATYGHTRERSGEIPESNTRQLFKTKIEHLIYLGSRNGPPKTLGDYITDFLIDEALAGQYLRDFKSWLLTDFKSDSKNYNVPNFWIKEVCLTPKEGELNRFILKVDPENKISEYYETNNTFILDIDLRPTPSNFKLNNFYTQLVDRALNDFWVNFTIKNTGEESGEALIRIYEGDENQGKVIYEKEQTITGKNIGDGLFSIETIVKIDPTKEDPLFCGKLKKYTLVVVNKYNNEIEIKREFSLPVYIGEVWGRVYDLFDNPVAGATIKSSTGQETTTSEAGFYHLVGINKLGKVTITASHPEFSQEPKKELNFKIDNFLIASNIACNQNNLLFSGVNFILKDVDVLFKVTVKDKKTGQIINAHLIATSKDGFRAEENVSNQTPLPGLQPGKYFFTLNAPGYKTIGQTVNAVPQDLELEFFMEKLNGRPTDGGIEIIEPQLLWQKNMGNEIFVEMRMTKDGKTVVFYTSQNKPNAGRLYFLESLNGREKKVVKTIANGGNSKASLDTSYDGNTTALCSNDGKTFGKNRGKNWIKLFDSNGNSIGEKEYDNQLATNQCEVSPDGFYLHPYALMNKGFYQYTLFDTQGIMNYKKPSEQKANFGSYDGIHFTTQNKVFGIGNQECNVALQNFNRSVIYCYKDILPPIFTDSSQDGQRIATIATDKVYLFSGANKIWEKEVKTKSHFLSTGITPGGKYVIYSTYSNTVPYRQIKIFTDNNLDKTPSSSQKGSKEDVVYVAANDKGIFYAALDKKTLKFYQVGRYTTDYQGEIYPTPTQTSLTSGISLVENGVFKPLDRINFYDLASGWIYYANQNTSFKVSDLGTIYLTAGTFFSVDDYYNPILLKGQMTADFNSPIKIYAIKFDRYDLTLFENKLRKFIYGNLPEEEYFLIENIHTKFIVKNEPEKINIAVEKGEVKIKGKNLEEEIITGNQITIDKKNQVKKSKYYGGKICLMLFVFVLIILFVLLFIYRNTKIGKIILKILKKSVELIFQIIKKIFNLLFLFIKNILNKLTRRK